MADVSAESGIAESGATRSNYIYTPPPTIDRVTWVDAVGQVPGSLGCNAELQRIYDSIQPALDELQPASAEIITPAFNAGHFTDHTGSGGWTVEEADVEYLNYSIVRGFRVMWLNFALRNTTTSVTTQLQLTLPDGFLAEPGQRSPLVPALDNGTVYRASASTFVTDRSKLFLTKFASAAWSSGANVTDVVGCVPIILVDA